MKPLATLNRPVLKTVDVETKEETVSFKERTDVTAVPAAGVVGETMVALVLAVGGAPEVRGRLAGRVRPEPRGVPRVVVVSARHLVLVGMMGAGKTSVGRRCATRLGRAFVDTDDLVEATTGMRVAEIFETQGESGVPRPGARRGRRRVRVTGAARDRVRRRRGPRRRQPTPAARRRASSSGCGPRRRC